MKALFLDVSCVAVSWGTGTPQTPRHTQRRLLPRSWLVAPACDLTQLPALQCSRSPGHCSAPPSSIPPFSMAWGWGDPECSSSRGRDASEQLLRRSPTWRPVLRLPQPHGGQTCSQPREPHRGPGHHGRTDGRPRRARVTAHIPGSCSHGSWGPRRARVTFTE